MVFEKKIQFLLLTIIVLFGIFSSDSFTIDYEESKTAIHENENNSYLSSDEIFALANQSQIFSFPPDTTLTLEQIDSLRADSVKLGLIEIDSSMFDSTARLAHFKYVRKDKEFLQFDEERKFSFFSNPSSRSIRRTVELDSTGNFVIIRELIANAEIRTPLKIPLEEYIEMRLASTSREGWEELGYKYKLAATKDDLGQLFSDITNIEIPLPSVSFLSIFGPPKISLKINGAVDIHGAWRNETTEGVTASLLGNTRNEPDFKQQVQINVNGTIGDKLTIAADWNTERTFEFENQLKLHYKGYEDEIIQSIEAGNVSLQTSPLVGGGEALFGIKALFQFGPFSLTALASQKKSEVEEVSVSGGSQKSQFEVRAYEYSQNHYFVDLAYADRDRDLFGQYFRNATPLIDPQYRIKEIEVWKTTSAQLDISTQRRANAFIDLPPREEVEPQLYNDSEWRNITRDPVTGREILNDRFVQMQEGVDFDYNPYAGFISFRTQISTEDAIAVAFRLEGQSGPVDQYYGEFIREVDSSKALVLKLVKPKKLQPGGNFSDAWTLQLKNIYPIGGRDVKKEGFTFDMNFQIPGQEPVNNISGKTLLEAFELDITDESGNGGPDGAFDWDPGRTILPSTGEIIFPTLEPFGRDFPEDFDPSFVYQAVYDTTVNFAKQDKTQDKFVLSGEYSADASSVYNIGFNAVENSVKVTLNGGTLQLGTDYSVDYNIGQVVIRNEDALVPGANLRITYEKNDLFQLASKTLLGLRGIYDYNDKTKFGFSFLNLNQTTLSDKVRIGEEPLNNTIFGLDFQTGFDMPFITKGLDYLISTREMSSVTLKGEFAYMNPDPNTKKSKIDSDNDESIAYIDDFEGAKRTIPIGVSYTGWRDISVPDQIPIIGSSSKQDQMNFKAKSYWYNILPSDVDVNNIWGDRKRVGRNDRITALDFVFDPARRGAYNYEPTLGNQIQNWGGMMRPLSSTASNLIEENIEFIEFWMKLNEAPEGAKLIIDLGQISEDIIPNGLLDQEDQNQNDRLEEEEDVGLDGKTNAAELLEYGDIDGTGDPSNDNFRFSLGTTDYSTINGTEGNGKLSDSGLLPDTEDMNKNFTLDKVNSYFRYEIPLDTTKARNEFISATGAGKGWVQFRIPLKEATAEIGNPSFTIVEVMRMWVSGVDQPIHIRLAELNLVGNQWQKVLVPGKVEDTDTTLVVGTINIEDNREYYSPPGVKQERDRTNPDEEIYKNEQSLQLKITDLEDGDKREIVKYLYRPLDLFSYKEMKLFVHGELNSNPGSISFYDGPDNHGAEVYFRFGTDTSNYYEYRQPVQSGWNEIAILFEQLTAIKQGRTETNIIKSIPVAGKEGHLYSVKGEPTLTRVNYFSFGINNPKDSGIENEEVSGELWVNELRVLGADDTPGWAYSASSSVKLADLLTVSVNASQTDPYFHKLNQRFGSRVDNTSWSGSANLNLLKLLPWNLTGSNLNVNYSHNESVSKPLYLPGTDINVDKAVEQAREELVASPEISEEQATSIAEEIRTSSQTINVSDTWSLSSIRFKLPSRSWYVEDIINNLSFAFSYNKAYSRSPSLVFQKSWVWNGSGKYTLNFSKNNFFFASDIPLLGSILEIFEDYKDTKFYFSPQSFNTGISASRKESANLSRTDSAAIKTQRDFSSNRDFGFNWKLTEGALLNLSLNYNVNVASSYAHLLAIDDVARSEKEIWNDIFQGAIFGRDYSYSQNFDVKTNPALPTLWNIRKYLNLSLGYNVNYKWTNNFKQESLGRSVGFSNSIRAGITLKWKSLTSPLFEESKESKQAIITNKGSQSSRNNPRNKKVIIDEDRIESEELTRSDSVNSSSDSLKTIEPKGDPIYAKALNYLKIGAKWLFFDYENLDMDFSQSNSSSSSGIRATGTGFTNFWSFYNNKNNGPSRMYMLGLSTDVGERAADAQSISDNFSQKNSIDFKTSRDLWDGAKISLNWKVGWGTNKSTRLSTDEFGNITINDITSNGTLDRSFIYLPIFFSEAGIKSVNEIYVKNGGDIAAAFGEGFESIPFLSNLPVFRDVVKYIPRANWRFDWRGLEKIGFIQSFAKSVSFNHAYTSGYSEGWKIDPDGNRQVQTQRINYGFSPLAGVNVTFDDMWGGNLSGGLKYSTKTSFDLGIATRNITESFSKDINFTASFSKSGFSLPMFGLDLKNDIEMSLSYTSAQNSIVIFEMDNFSENGKPQDGTTRTI
ncbi:MAG: cell surface protein SprA, partial [Melioribacteraceae bacterium]|nr:cell surface protein SprA [Melioribacteraceae bacterium]